MNEALQEIMGHFDTKQEIFPNDVELIRDLKSSMEEMGPAELATTITSTITDNQYLKDVIKYMTDNLILRNSEENNKVLPF